MRNTSHHNTHTLTHTHTITNTHIKSRSAAVKLWFNHRSNTVFAGKSVEVKNKYFRLQWLSSGSDTILTANNVDTFCFVPINTSASMCYRGVLHRSLLTRRKTAFPPIKTKGKKKTENCNIANTCKQRIAGNVVQSEEQKSLRWQPQSSVPVIYC